MKKIVALALAMALACAFLLAGCGPAKTEEPSAAPTEAAEPSVAPEESPADQPSEEPAASPETPEESPAAQAPADNPLAGKKIGCTIVYKGDEWCANLATSLESLAAEYGAEIVVEDGDLNDETQSKQIENMVANGVDIIFADPATPDGCTEALNKAVDAGIPVIIYDGYWTEDKAVTTITWNQPLTGELTANYLIDYVNKNMDGKAKVVCLTLKTSTHCIEREEKFKEVIAEKAPGIEIINTQDCEGNREKGANAITNIVEPFDFVASVVDNGAWGAISAIEARGLDNVKVLSMGAYGKEPFDALKANHPNYMACVVVPPPVVAKGVYDAAVKYYNGESVEKLTNIDIAIADSSNVDQYWDFGAAQ